MILIGVDASVRDQIVPDALVRARSDIRALAVDTLRADRPGFELPPGSWNAARTLLAIGAQAWHLTGTDAVW